MYTRLSMWLCQLAANLGCVRGIGSNRYIWRRLLRDVLYDTASNIDAVAKVYLHIRARCLWARDRFRSRLAKDEFDRSLSMDTEILLYLNKKDQKRYQQDLARRRKQFHERSLC